jgi:hypothetical protein
VVTYVLFLIFWGEFVPKEYQKNLNYNVGSSGHIYSRLKEVKYTKGVDILFLGSSHTYRGFDTRIFQEKGYTTFNLGSSSQTPLQTRLLLNRYLDQLDPKIVIYEVYPLTLTMDGVESSLDLMANDKNDFGSIHLALQQKHIKVYNTMLYSFYRDFFHRNDGCREYVTKLDDHYVKGGYVEKDLKFYKNVQYTKQEWELNSKQFEIFNQIVKELKKRKIKVFLVQAPISSSLYNSYTNNKNYDRKMKHYGDYYNFNKLMMLNDSLHFYDANHLNQLGVELFNKKLIETVLQKNLSV